MSVLELIVWRILVEESKNSKVETRVGWLSLILGDSFKCLLCTRRLSVCIGAVQC